MTKRYGTAIVAIAKDENPYLLEWLAYHIALGFEHIWVYDNMSRVGLDRLLSKNRSRRYVTIVKWADRHGGNAQLEAYEHYLRHHGARVRWTAVIDIDEFICLKRHRDIGSFLDTFGDASGVAINWRYFGSDGQVEQQSGLLIERFTRASEVGHGVNEGIKSIYRTATVSRLMHHYSEYKGAARVVSSNGEPIENHHFVPVDPANLAVAQVNHYFVKSRAEWQKKLQRGYGWVFDDRSELFERCDRNEVEETSILSRLEETKDWMRKIGADQPAAAETRAWPAKIAEALRSLLRRRG